MVYQVDCITGMVENVIPTYAGGYGVGQMLPSAYSYYNLPMQYRSMYYPTADYSYWYAPGAIYQYDTRSSLITSVAALTYTRVLGRSAAADGLRYVQRADGLSSNLL